MRFITEIIILTLIIIISAFAISFIPGEKENKYVNKFHEFMSGEIQPKEGGDSGDNKKAGVEMIEGNIAVRLPENIQQQAGIQITTLEQVTHLHEQHTFGEVEDIQSLLELRSRYNSIQSDRIIAESSLLASRQEYDRLQLLHNEASNISDRQLQQAKSQWMSDSAQVQAKKQEMEDIRNEAVQSWGRMIVDWVLKDSEIFKGLTSGEQVLLLITLGSDQLMPPDTEIILVSRNGNRESAQEAFYISPAPRTDTLIQGETYYFHTRAERLRAGMRLDAWIPAKDSTIQGVIIPASAVIWYVDKPWVYLQMDNETFKRQALINYTESREGWFVEESLHTGDRIVLHGGQMLLSEEFRWSIPDEDDNP